MVGELLVFKERKTKTSIKRTPLFKLLYEKYHFCYCDGSRGRDVDAGRRV